MPQPVLIRGSYKDMMLLVPALLGLIVLLPAMFADAAEVRNGFGMASAALLVFASFRFFQVQGRREWIEPTETGFIWSNRRGEATFGHGDLLSIALKQNLEFSNGVYTGMRRKGTLLMAGEEGAKSIAFDYATAKKREDTLAPLFNRLFADLAERSWQLFASGGKLPGIGWELNSEGLALHPAKGEPKVVPHDRLAAIAEIEGHVTVWEKDDPFPAIRVPSGAMNALVLREMLQRKLSDQPPASSEGTGPDCLGRVLFERERRTNRLIRLLLYPLAGLLLVAGLAMPFVKPEKPAPGQPKDDAPLVLVGLVMAACGLFTLYFALDMDRKKFRVQEFGVAMESFRKRKILKYADIVSMKWSETKFYTHGAYAGTKFALVFQGDPASEQPTVKFGKTIRNVDEGLNQLREIAANAVAARMFRQILAGESIPWCRGYVFEPDKLGGGRKWAKYGYEQGLPYAKITEFLFKDGYLHVFAESKNTSLFNLVTSQPNLYPGYFLLLKLVAQARENAPS